MLLMTGVASFAENKAQFYNFGENRAKLFPYTENRTNSFPFAENKAQFSYFGENRSEFSPDDNDESLFWLNGGLGVGASEKREGIALGANFSYQRNQHLFSLRTALFAEFELFGQGGGFVDAGLLYGRIAKGDYGFASISGGPGIVHGNPNSEEVTTIGLPLETQLFFTPFSFLGIGFTGFANINPQEPFYGGLVSVQIGKLR